MYSLIAKLSIGLSEIMRQFKNEIMGKTIQLFRIYSCLHADSQAGRGVKLLEVGCGEGKRLHWITENEGLQCYGVDPSEKAVSIARKKTVQVIQGTADELDFENQSFAFWSLGFAFIYVIARIFFELPVKHIVF